MSYLPIFFNLEDKKILVIGGGKAALQKIKGLIPFTKAITVVAPQILPQIKEFNIHCLIQAYNPNLLTSFQLIFACTNNATLNQEIKNEAQTNKILVQAVGQKQSDFISPATFSTNDITFALSSQRKALKKTVLYRDQLKHLFEQKNFQQQFKNSISTL